MNRKWKKVLTFAFAMSIAVNLAAFDGGRSKEQEKKLTPATEIDSPKEIQASVGTSGEEYVVVMTDSDTSPLKVYQKYLDSADQWRQLTEHNLLQKGVAVKVPKDEPIDDTERRGAARLLASDLQIAAELKAHGIS